MIFSKKVRAKINTTGDRSSDPIIQGRTFLMGDNIALVKRSKVSKSIIKKRLFALKTFAINSQFMTTSAITTQMARTKIVFIKKRNGTKSMLITVLSPQVSYLIC